MAGGRPGSLTDEQVRRIRVDYARLMQKFGTGGRPKAQRIIAKREGCSAWQVLAVVYYKTYQRVT